MPKFAILEAPSILGLQPTGVDRLPEALLAAGLGTRLQARHAGRLEPRSPYSAELDPETRMLNPRALLNTRVRSRTLSAACSIAASSRWSWVETAPSCWATCWHSVAGGATA